MDRKLDQARAFVEAGNWDAAFSLVSKWPRLGPHKADIQRAQSARLSPALYRQMGKDLKAIEGAGRKALVEWLRG